jgi:hypothetical protein
MFAPRQYSLWRRLVRRLPTGLALVSYLVATVGLPLSVGPVKDQSQPFPCQHHLCGCRNAAECWQHCCCFSHAEKQAWARAHGVTPPAEAEQVTASGWHTTRLRDRPADKPEGCAACPHCVRQKEATPAALSARDSGCTGRPGATSCCRSAPSLGDAERRSDRPSASLPVVSAPKCQGLTTLWISARTVPPPLATLSWSPCWPMAGWLGDFAVLMSSASLSPPDPPPRQFCA